MSPPDITIEPYPQGWRVRFNAMASPCEVLLEGGEHSLAERLGALAASEAWRIEAKYSRYHSDSVTSAINRNSGGPYEVDGETAALLDYADSCHRLSDGLFDITSGILRRIWSFKSGAQPPTQREVRQILPLIGWQHVQWSTPQLILPPGMEIDLGGVGKEYAVDRTLALLRHEYQGPLLVNFGGDLAVSGPRLDGTAWQVAVDDPQRSGHSSSGQLQIRSGAIATSGDARRHLMYNGVRYSHILNPKNGWPVPDAPRSVTIAAPTCLEAGLLATLASLYGGDAEAFLAAQQLPSRVIR